MLSDFSANGAKWYDCYSFPGKMIGWLVRKRNKWILHPSEHLTPEEVVETGKRLWKESLDYSEKNKEASNANV